MSWYCYPPAVVPKNAKRQSIAAQACQVILSTGAMPCPAPARPRSACPLTFSAAQTTLAADEPWAQGVPAVQAALQQILQTVQRSEVMGCPLALITGSNAALYRTASEGLALALQGGALCSCSESPAKQAVHVAVLYKAASEGSTWGV